MKNEKKIFKIAVQQEVYATMKIEAETLEKAYEIAKADITSLPTETYYVEDSFEINEEMTNFFLKENKNYEKEY